MKELRDLKDLTIEQIHQLFVYKSGTRKVGGLVPPTQRDIENVSDIDSHAMRFEPIPRQHYRRVCDSDIIRGFHSSTFNWYRGTSLIRNCPPP